MGTTIRLDSANRKSATTAVTTDSVLTCSNTSAADVYVTGIISNKEEHALYSGESMAVPKVSTLIVRIFRNTSGAGSFSAELDLAPIPDAPKPKTAAKSLAGAKKGKGK